MTESSASNREAELDRLLKSVPNLSEPSTTKFAAVEAWMASLLGIGDGDLRALYVSKPGNFLVRFRQPGLLKKRRRLGIAVLKTDADLDGNIRAAVKLLELQEYVDNVVLCTPGDQDDGSWQLSTIVATSGDDLVSKLRSLFPESDVVEVARGAGAKAEELIVDPSALKPDSPTPRQPTLVTVITPDIVKTVLSERALYLPDGLVLTALAALRANKHVLLTGPPGTGKTTFAEVLGESARRAGVAAGWFLTTATADWTSVDTVGGYRLTKDGDLSFWPGQVLQAIDAESWLVIDEFNRADIDKCFGQLFTVLSGQAVTLPFVDSEGDGEEMVSIVPEGAGPPSDTVPHYVDAEWRLLCTLNSRDRDFLFKLSYALLRRFAVIEIPIPDDAAYDAILSAKGATGSAELDKSLRELARLPARRLGPAILLDCAGYLRERRTLGGTAEDEWLWICEAIDEFVLPQLDDLTAAERRAVVGHLTSRVVGSNRAAEVARLVGNRLGVTPAELLPRDELASEALDEQ